jgi:Tfp pilus assembly protein PilV
MAGPKTNTLCAVPMDTGRHSRRGAVLFEALMALIILATSIFAFIALFNRNAARMARSNRDRGAALFADSILNSLRAVSEEQARQTNWFGFWSDFLSASPATNMVHPFPDAWSNQTTMANGLLVHGTPPWDTMNPLATDKGTIAYGSNSPDTVLSPGTLRTNVFGWYRRHTSDEAGMENFFGGNERHLPPDATTRRSSFRHRLSACFVTNGVGLTNRVGVLVEVWPGESGLRSATNRVAMYAEFADEGVL